MKEFLDWLGVIPSAKEVESSDATSPFDRDSGILKLRHGETHQFKQPCCVKYVSGGWAALELNGITPIPYTGDSFPEGITIVALSGGCVVHVTFSSR